ETAKYDIEACAGTIVEFEIALELGRDITPSSHLLTGDHVAPAVAAIRPAIELPIKRFAEPVRPDLLLIEAANSGSYKLVVGNPVPIENIEELSTLEGLLSVNGSIEASGHLPPSRRADPLRSLTHLANICSQRNVPLTAGQI